MRRVIWLVGAAVAAAAALALMFAARSAFQIRTLPERLMETFLLVIPPDQFEAAIERYGPMAKDLALDGAIAATFLVLMAIGWLALWYVARSEWVLAIGVGLWLLTAVVLWPVTGAGPFATGLLQNPYLLNVVYLGIGLLYALVLLLTRWLTTERPAPSNTLAAQRRALVGGAGATVLSFLATLWFGRTAGQIASSLPLASVPAASEPPPASSAAATTPPSVSPPASVSAAAARSQPASSSAAASSQGSSSSPSASASAAGPSSQAASTSPAASPTIGVSYPEPPPERALARDKDGALLAVNRPKGQQQPAVTANADFYTVTKNAAGDPQLNARDWRLIVDGAVNKPVQLDYLGLLKLPAVTIYKTLECISNLTAKCDLTSFGCDLVSNAHWKGARLADVIQLAGGLKPGVVAIAAIAADEFSSSLPAGAASDPAVLLVYEMNGSVLPREHGFPVRLLMPDRYGMKSAKWLVNVKPMTQPYLDWYGQRDWSLQGIVKTMSRIDVPADGAAVQAGPNPIAGIAYAGSRGVAKVEFSASGGQTWRTAALEAPLGQDTFVRWSGTFNAQPGQALSLTVRAVDGTGQLQSSQFTLPQPDGGAGWHSIDVKVA